tara:strand:+ start:9430 stop:9753 length:324 start_codon:yes stop_codon:yes gene_type:complete
VAALLTAGAGYLLMHRLQTESIQSIQQTMNTWRLTLTLLRWGVIAVVAFSWRHVVQRLSASGKLSSVQAEYLTGLRWRAATWLILLELVLGQGMVVKFLDLIAETNG